MKSSENQTAAREVALKALGVYRRNTAWSDLTLSGLITSSGMSELDAALTTALVNGVLQNMALCDYYAANFSSIELKKLEPRVLDVLRMSIYQLVFLTKTPHSAAVNEGVALAKKYSNSRAAGYVNAVLRKVAKAAEDGELPEINGDPLQKLSVTYSHPQWLVGQLIEVLGLDGTEALLKLNNSGATPITAQVNTLVTNVDETLYSLKSEGVDAEKHEWLDNCIFLRGAGNITRLDAFKKGFFYVQDVASRLAIIAADPKKSDFLIDGCAAPGGKTFACAIAMQNSGRIAAFDLHTARLRHLENGAKRLGINIIGVAKKDSSTPSEEFAGTADVVIADVPCSGFGVIHKKPDIRYKSEQETAGLPAVQKRILSSLSSYVSPGGTLMYNTCTVLKRENESVIEWFLSENGQFKPESFTLPGIGEVNSGMLTLWPHIHGTDGFFMCKLRNG